jgi:hypothetical protein
LLLFRSGLLLRSGAEFTAKNYMCLALYIAASKSLPVVPWDPEKPTFHVVPIPESMQAVRKLLPFPHIYYVGSHEGCSCAFNYEHEFKSALDLRDYLRKALTVVDEIVGFSHRLGKEQLNILHSVTISPGGIALPEFFFQDGQRLLFRSRKTMQAQRRRPDPVATSSRKRVRVSARRRK